VSIDVTAGIEMYENFSKDPAFWREFFIKNSHRIIFGTDSTDASEDAASGDKVNIDGYAGAEIEFLRFDKDIEIFDKKLHGLGLPDGALKRIFEDNYHAYVGKIPRTMDMDALRKEAAFIRNYLTDEAGIEALDYIVSQFALM